MFSEIIRLIGELFTWFFCVAPWEQAIRIRAGKYVRTLGAGFYIRIPFVDRVYKQSVRRRLHVIKAQTLTTKDGRIVTCSGAVGFEIGDLKMLYDTLESPNETIECEVAGIVADYVGAREWNDCGIEELERHVADNLDLKRYGLASQEYYITSLATAKAYRLITGDLPGWSRDDMIDMRETRR